MASPHMRFNTTITSEAKPLSGRKIKQNGFKKDTELLWVIWIRVIWISMEFGSLTMRVRHLSWNLPGNYR
eukprot:scaffold18788_cov66-Cyclotella_meneghiniana.AAC.3